jgi:hypothetical protein
VRIHTAYVGRGIPAFPVHGALTDHHRLIRQFGVAPLMYYLYGDNVIINVGEDPRMGSVGPSTTCFKTHQPVERRMYAMIKNFHLALEIPMAVTGVGLTAKLAEVVQTISEFGG